MVGFLLRAALIALSLATTGAAAAQAICGDRDGILDRLAEVYGEEPISIGLGARGKVFEVLVSPSGSWTILATLPNGVSCIVAAGEAWQALPAIDGDPQA